MGLRSHPSGAPTLPAFPPVLRLPAALLVLAGLAAAVFATLPQLDLRVAAVFAREGAFVGDTAAGRGARHVGEYLPVCLLALYGLLYAMRRWLGFKVWAPTAGGLAVMALSLALGPGLLVNAVLKNHSHRPRPVQVDAFGGPYPFRPFWRFDGACATNCSFVSGEGSTAFWTVAPALLTPLPLRPVMVGAAVLFGVAVGTLRMAFGGHFLSDTVFGALFAWGVVWLCWVLVARLTGRSPRAPDPPRDP